MHKVARLLLKWYRSNRILYPWRFTKDPYRVWLSEVLLQQTRIPVVLQYYEKILHQFPSLQALASARDSDFLSAWSGLGYYRRAHNMLRCARELVSRHNGRFPLDLQTLQSLPGIGPYTAGAIRNICFDLLTPTADGNISRVLARITNNRHRMSTHAFRTEIARSFLEWGQDAPPGEYLQSLMELGEQICLPKPECPRCPMQKLCLAYKKRSVLKIPQRPVKKEAEDCHWYFLVLRRKNSYYFVRNGQRAFLKDAWLFPDLLVTKRLSGTRLRTEYGRTWKIDLPNFVHGHTLRHSVTFRRIHAHVLRATEFRIRNGTGKWLTRNELMAHHTSSITKKILKLFAPFSA